MKTDYNQLFEDLIQNPDKEKSWLNGIMARIETNQNVLDSMRSTIQQLSQKVPSAYPPY